MQKYSQAEYFSYIFSICVLVATGWILGHDDHLIIKYWYALIMSLLLIIRIPDFKRKKYHHFLSELCYFVNLSAIYFMIMDFDLKPIYPYLHGPLLLYAIMSGDAFIPHDLPKTTSFALHSFGTIVTRHLYHNQDSLLTLNELTTGAFIHYLTICVGIYFIWFLPYSCYVFWYKGKSLTMIKYTLKLKEDDSVTFLTKVSYLLRHMILTTISISIGIFLMHTEQMDNFMCVMQLCSGIIQGSYYYANGKKLKFASFVKSCFSKKKTENVSNSSPHKTEKKD
jgi:hypothetical protein